MSSDSWGGFLKRLEYISVDDKSTTLTLTDDVTLTATKSTEIKNNICQITLRNTPSKYDTNYIHGSDVSSGSYSVQFQEEDMISLYLKHTNDGTDFVDSTWATTDYLIGEYIVEELGFNTAESSTRISLKCVDRAYIIFNIVWNYSYGVGDTFTAPGILRHAVRVNSEAISTNIKTFSGTGKDAGVSYNLDAKFTSEGGNVQDYRTVLEGSPKTLLSGALNSTDTTIDVDSTTGYETIGTIVITDGTDSEHISYTGVTTTSFTGCTRGMDDTLAQSHLDDAEVFQGFPEILLSKSWKPIFEWIADISEPNYTNYADEVGEGDTLFYNRTFLIWFDKQNQLHWLPADNTVDISMELGDEDLRAMRLEKSVFNSVNFVIYNCGEDMNGNGIMHYWYDQNSEVKSLKMRYQPMTEIIYNFVRDDINNYNITRDTTATQDKLKQYPDSGEYPISTWSFKSDSNSFRNLLGLSPRATLTDDTDYNDSLREGCKYRGLLEAQSITSKTSGLRYKGDLVVTGQHINPGDLIQITNRFTGQVQQLIRVINVRHTVNQKGWETILEVEEDEKVET